MYSDSPDKKVSGLTLIELMVVVAIVGIISGTIISLAHSARSSGIQYISKRVQGSLVLARSEAIKRGRSVSLCRYQGGHSCANGSNWHDGWVVFIDINNNNRIDASEILKAYDSIPDGFNIRWSQGESALIFDRNGRTNVPGTFSVCNSGLEEGPVQVLSVSVGGQIKQNSAKGICR
ncbi:hypothetical protein CI610_01965 [invertebrate metagenome]|uniref:General secretion pathway GspH domain-containing protein n=1 Tax=invertebrate metagenome TaxID=1711999 RepID=A0A2H9T782_9ZZZZ